MRDNKSISTKQGQGLLKKKNLPKKIRPKSYLNSQGIHYTHRKISESEKENVGVEAAHKTEQAMENILRHSSKQTHKKDSKSLNKLFQRQRIKREYQKSYRAVKKGETSTYKTSQAATKVINKVTEMVVKNKGIIISVVVIGFLLMMLTASVTSCTAMFASSMSTLMSSTWNSDPMDIDAAEMEFTLKEAQLEDRINHLENEYAGYDEYRYNVSAIGHNPFELISYLSAKYETFTYEMITAELNTLFNEMYSFTASGRTETRTRLESQIKTSIDPVTGDLIQETVLVEVQYNYYILEINLVSVPFENIVTSHLDADQFKQYEAYLESKGGLQQLGTPFTQDWYAFISSYYGYRISPITSELQIHRGLDIALPGGTEIKAAQSGTVVTAAYDNSYGNYIVMNDEAGYTTKYAHLSQINVSVGQVLNAGEIIGEVGSTGNSTGNHLHIEVLYNNQYFNPLFYLNNGNGTLN